MPNGGAATTSSATSSFINGDTSETSSKMREKLAALEDLNELLEEPVEEQVSVLTSYLGRYFIWNTVTKENIGAQIWSQLEIWASKFFKRGASEAAKGCLASVAAKLVKTATKIP